ncbi:MAG: hypothetical protein JWM57_3571, partial [Phycisphaerales bacterium]|nr:hypothetical protein [Phycisphaerales bacterium]
MNARICGTALLLSLIWTAGMHAKTTASTAEDDTDTAGSLDRAVVDAGDATRFSRVFDKGRRGEPITIGFIGGSITAGYAAHDAPHRYVDRVAAWFARIFPASQVKLINAGVGGTGSDFGALRVQADVLKQQPDVVVVEFAVNDEDNEHAGRTLEGVVRQVLSAPNAPACLLLFMSHDGRNAQAWHAKVGRHYGLPMVSYRDGLAAEIDAGRLKWADISPDDIHPNDRGHAIAARYITHLLDNLLTAMPRGATVPSSSLPTPLLSDLYANVETHDADTLRPTKADGWAYDPATRSWRADRPGSVIEFNTSGRGAALMYYRIHQDYGRAKVTVDGAHDQIADGWFAPTWGGYRHTSELATDLPPGEHTVRVELLADKAPQSSGHEFRILGLAALGVAASDSAGPVAYQWKNVPIGGGGYISGVFAHP